MFVQQNRLSDMKRYFQRELSAKYSSSELKLIIKALSFKRLKISDSDFILSDNVYLSESDLLFFHAALKRLRLGEPFQYVMGQVLFAGIDLKVSPGVLIPRPETEELVAWVLEDFKGDKDLSVVDLCSGSGCIGLAIEKKLHPKHLTLVEFSDSAIEVLRENCKQLNSQAEITKADVLLPFWWKDVDMTQMDVLCSNPPYVLRSDAADMNVNVLDFEPHMALFVDDSDPLVFYKAIASFAMNKLKENGFLYVEIHEDMGAEVESLFHSMGFVNTSLRKDFQGKDRILRAKR